MNLSYTTITGYLVHMHGVVVITGITIIFHDIFGINKKEER